MRYFTSYLKKKSDYVTRVTWNALPPTHCGSHTQYLFFAIIIKKSMKNKKWWGESGNQNWPNVSEHILWNKKKSKF